ILFLLFKIRVILSPFVAESSKSTSGFLLAVTSIIRPKHLIKVNSKLLFGTVSLISALQFLFALDP
ncbi:MAG TPA: hypothetical protein H9853_00990, partial [Candidatus Sphingobacterium stercoripullorum]|nr:hypothetical protein [Candidatus Sphingobacterium stercoripullorum]